MRASANLDKINFKKDKIFLVLKFHFLEARAALANHGEERGVCRALKVTGKTRQGNVIKCFFAQNILRIKHIILPHKGKPPKNENKLTAHGGVLIATRQSSVHLIIISLHPNIIDNN